MTRPFSAPHACPGRGWRSGRAAHGTQHREMRTAGRVTVNRVTTAGGGGPAGGDPRPGRRRRHPEGGVCLQEGGNLRWRPAGARAVHLEWAARGLSPLQPRGTLALPWIPTVLMPKGGGVVQGSYLPLDLDLMERGRGSMTEQEPAERSPCPGPHRGGIPLGHARLTCPPALHSRCCSAHWGAPHTNVARVGHLQLAKGTWG